MSGVRRDAAIGEVRKASLVAKHTSAQNRQELLLQIANVLTTNLERDSLFGAIAEVVHSFVGIDRATLALYEPDRDEFEIVALALQEHTHFGKGWSLPHAGSRVGKVFDSGEPYLSTLGEDSEFFEDTFLVEEGMHTGLVVPMRINGKPIGTFNVNCREEHALSQEDVELLSSVADQIAIAVANSRIYQQARVHAEGLRLENAHLQELIQGAETAASLLLNCPSTRSQIDNLVAIAQSDATVLIVGETGVGKGVMARALHAWSGRRYRPFLRCDCTALTPPSIEADFFGQGRGDGHGRRPGRFEKARGGTVFLDEIAEIPLPIQARLLGVIQDHTLQRPGSERPLHLDFRAIASTHHDLAAEVAASRFREDLYYRLKVVTVSVLPLRERKIDIAPLAEHFISVLARATGRAALSLAPESVRLLAGYEWPGNVRELEHVIERAMVLHPGGDVLRIDPESMREHRQGAAGEDDEGGPLVPLAELEARYIRRVLRATKGRVAGPRGAARILGMNPSTLRSRMVKLGIRVERG